MWKCRCRLYYDINQLYFANWWQQNIKQIAKTITIIAVTFYQHIPSKCQTQCAQNWRTCVRNFNLLIAINPFVSDMPNESRHSVTTSSDVDLKTFFIRVLFTVNSNDISWFSLTGQASKAHNRHGKHL